MEREDAVSEGSLGGSELEWKSSAPSFKHRLHFLCSIFSMKFLNCFERKLNGKSSQFVTLGWLLESSRDREEEAELCLCFQKFSNSKNLLLFNMLGKKGRGSLKEKAL